jgi:hypothetical protein
MWRINDDGVIPPLPRRLSPSLGQNGEVREMAPAPLREGCWIAQLDPVLADDFDAVKNPDSPLKGWTVCYLGTVRVEKLLPENKRSSSDFRVSGDLYLQRQAWSVKGAATAPQLPLVNEIPIFPIKDYAIYFTLKQIDHDAREALLSTFRYDAQGSTWDLEEVLTAKVEDIDPAKVPEAWKNKEYLCWSVRNDRGTVIARLQMGRISDYLRRAQIDIACAEGCEPPLKNGLTGDLERTLERIFHDLDWKVTVPTAAPAKGPADLWDEGILHAKMLELRSSANLDKVWTYHVLVVPRWQDTEELGFGKMYDVGAVDSNMVPREGLVVAAAAKFPDEDRFGSARGQKLADVRSAALHNLLHELGHAMGLLHRFHGRGFMQGLIYIADLATPEKQFPGNLDFAYDAEDELRLRHFPDIWIRPGGIPFGQGYSALPVPDADAITDVTGQFELTAKPVRRHVPLGAPVRLQMRLTNVSGLTLPGPVLLSLSAGSLAGRVVGPGERTRTFSGAAPLDFVWTAGLDPGMSLYRGETLLRGPEGALFPEPGRYRIEVEAGWVAPGGIARLGTRCEVVVPPPESRRHKRIARDLLAAEGLAILLIFRPAPGTEGQPGNESVAAAAEALRRALKTPELRGSFASIEARRLAAIDLIQAAGRIDRDTLMTTSEIESLLGLAIKAPRKLRKDRGIHRMVEILRSKIRRAVCKGLAPHSLLDKAEDFLRCC